METDKLKEHIESLVNEQIAMFIVEKLKRQLQESWAEVLTELVDVRKRLYSLEEQYNQTRSYNSKLESLIDVTRKQQRKTLELQSKEDKLLEFLVKEFAVEEG